ncbi:MAG: hypothetical protein SV765_15015 [Pseudomonadota bacterium]|nr:hypothetical protein [Pseudomonadales bacterium]MDY6921512.1 hypothetical protein [Pseudomonadota bacterium]
MKFFNERVLCPLALLACGVAASSAHAIVIEASYGTNDGFGSGFAAGSPYEGNVFPTPGPGDEPFEDRRNNGSFSWSPIDLSGYSTINSIAVEYSVYGMLAGSELTLNNYAIANLESEMLGSEGMPEQYVWSEQVDITDRSMLDALFQQEITLEFVSAALANLWSLDYVNLVIDVDELSGSEPEEPEDNDTVAISEPFTFSLFGLALLGMGLSRRRSGA